MTYKHAMLDIETLSTHTSRAVVLSAGFVPFNLNHDGPVIGQRFLLVFDAMKQIAAGRRVDQSTVDFWASQSDAARAHWRDPKFTREGVIVFREVDDHDPAQIIRNLFGKRHGGLQLDETAEIWSNGAVFDFGNLENLLDFRAMGDTDAPWHFRSVRDMRTIVKTMPEFRGGEELPGQEQNYNPELAHDPVADCEWQIEKLWRHVWMEEVS